MINDLLWGSIRLHQWEVALLDTYLLQRLRQIRQLGVAHWVYPGAGHTRFEHSLGAMHQTQCLIDGIERNSGRAGERIVDDVTTKLLRLAALLHDVGHALLSHVTELKIAALPGMSDLIQWVTEEFKSRREPSPSEAVAVAFVMSPAFRDFLRIPEVGADFIKDADEASRTIARFIVGGVEGGREYLSQLVNGAFDADKLDYMPRDCQMAGIPCAVDVTRVIEKIHVESTADDGTTKRVLSLESSGERTLQELAITRSLLFNKVYYHHKIRALEKVACDVLDRLAADEGWRSAIDWLRRTDDDALRDVPGGNPLRERRLPKRAFVIAPPEKAEDENGQDARTSWRRVRSAVRDKSLCAEIRKQAVRAAELLGFPALDAASICVDEPDMARAGLEDQAFLGAAPHEIRLVDGTTTGGRPEAAKRLTQQVIYVFADESVVKAAFLACRKTLAEFGIDYGTEVCEKTKLDVGDVAAAEAVLKERGYYGEKLPTPLAATERPTTSAVDMEALLKSAWPRVEALAIDFGRYQGMDAEPVSPARIGDFLRQFETVGRARAALRLLEQIRIKDRAYFVDALRGRLVAARATASLACVSPLGESGDSSALLGYLVGDLPELERVRVRPLAAALAEDSPDAIVLWDDFCGAGGHTVTVLGQWLGLPAADLPLDESHVDALPPDLREKLRARRLIIAFAMATAAGIAEVRSFLEKHGLANASVLDPGETIELVDTVFAGDAVYPDEAVRTDLRNFLAAKGRELLEPKTLRAERPWKLETLASRVLGYGNAAQLLVFHYNVPTVTITALWASGASWEPLFVRRGK